MGDTRKEFWDRLETIKMFENRPPSKYITDTIDYVLEIKDKVNALDAGCGAGRYSFYLKDKGVNVFALDKHEKIAKNVTDHGIPFIREDICCMSRVGDSLFDLVLSIGVLHNVISETEFKKSIHEMSRVLKKGGYLICSVFTNDLIDDDLRYQFNHKYIICGNLPMMLFSRENVDKFFNSNGLIKVKNIDEHITDVGTGKRYVYTALFKKE